MRITVQREKGRVWELEIPPPVVDALASIAEGNDYEGPEHFVFSYINDNLIGQNATPLALAPSDIKAEIDALIAGLNTQIQELETKKASVFQPSLTVDGKPESLASIREAFKARKKKV